MVSPSRGTPGLVDVLAVPKRIRSHPLHPPRDHDQRLIRHLFCRDRGRPPTPSITDVASVLDVAPENAQLQFDYIVRGALAAVRTVLPDMLDKGDGGLIFTVGGSAITPTPMMGNVGIAMAGLRNYVSNLHKVLKSKGIYAGTMAITGWFKSTDPTPARIAASINEMYEQREQGERVFEV